MKPKTSSKQERRKLTGLFRKKKESFAMPEVLEIPKELYRMAADVFPPTTDEPSEHSFSHINLMGHGVEKTIYVDHKALDGGDGSKEKPLQRFEPSKPKEC